MSGQAGAEQWNLSCVHETSAAVLIHKEQSMSASHRSHLSIATLIVALITPWGITAEAQNEIYPSTNLEGSKASYVIQFTLSYSGRVDKIRVSFRMVR
jgi:hypothetical protein